MTAPRSERSAWLLVGCTPGTAAKVHSAGHALRRFRVMPRQYLLDGDFSFELSAIAGVLEDLPCPEQSLADVQPEFPEPFLVGETFSVSGEVPAKMCPADLPARERQMAIGPPAVRGDDRRGVGEQHLGVILVPVRGNMEVRVPVGEHAPQRTL